MTDRISVTMTPEAAERFLKALSYAESIVHLRAEELADSEGTSRRVQTAVEHGDWLRWGYSRVAAATLLHDVEQASTGSTHDGAVDRVSRGGSGLVAATTAEPNRASSSDLATRAERRDESDDRQEQT